MLTQYNLKMPHAVYGGENAMDNITAIIKARGAKKVAMFTDKGIEGAGLFALPEEAVKASGAEYYVLDELPPEPSYMAVQKLVDENGLSDKVDLNGAFCSGNCDHGVCVTVEGELYSLKPEDTEEFFENEIKGRL